MGALEFATIGPCEHMQICLEATHAVEELSAIKMAADIAESRHLFGGVCLIRSDIISWIRFT